MTELNTDSSYDQLYQYMITTNKQHIRANTCAMPKKQQ